MNPSMNLAELREQLAPIAAHHAHPQTAIVPILHELLGSQHSIAPEALEVVSSICHVDTVTLQELIAHYAIFQNNSSSVKTSVCLDLPCYLNGAKQVVEELKAGASAEVGEVTVSTCLGHCYAAPVVKLEDGTICKARLTNTAK